MKSPKTFKVEAAHIEARISTIQILAEVLISNGCYKGGPGDTDPAPQIPDRGESGIQQAIQLLAGIANREFCQMASDLGIPQ